MHNLFKTYNDQFGSCNILRSFFYNHYYWRYTECPFLACLYDECSCLLIDAGTIIKDEAIQKVVLIKSYFLEFILKKSYTICLIMKMIKENL